MTKIKPKPATSEGVYSSSVDLIRQIDETLEMVRGWWMASVDLRQKKNWMDRIDRLLDERIKVMNVRNRQKQ